MKRAPGPRGLAALLSPFRFQRDPLGFLDGLAREYGELVELRLGPQRAFVVSHPDHVRRIYVDEAGRYGKPVRIKKILAPLLGEGLFTSEGEKWRRSRRLAQPFFHRQALADTLPVVDEAARKMVERIGAHAEPDLAVESTRLSMHVAARMFLGVDVGPELDALAPLVAAASNQVAQQIVGFVPLPLWVPTAGNRAYRTLIDRFRAISDALIAARRRAPTPGDDFVGKLVSARDPESGRGYSDDEIRDELSTFFMAGHDTTANSLAWTFYLVSQHPAVEERLRAEAETALGERAPTAQDLAKLEYTTRVVEETNRLFPQAWVMGREALDDDEIDGCLIPRGSAMFISSWLTHRSEKYWERPSEFDPDRFQTDRSKNRPKYAYYPFGAGQRLCIGNNLSMIEAVMALAYVIREFELRVRDGHRAVPRARFALEIEGGLPMRAIRRARRKQVA